MISEVVEEMEKIIGSSEYDERSEYEEDMEYTSTDHIFSQDDAEYAAQILDEAESSAYAEDMSTDDTVNIRMTVAQLIAINKAVHDMMGVEYDSYYNDKFSE